MRVHVKVSLSNCMRWKAPFCELRSAFAGYDKIGRTSIIDSRTSHKYHPRQSGLPRGSAAMRCALVALALVALATPALSLDVPPALTTPSVAQPSQEQEGRPSLLRRVSAPLATPVRMFREAPPITRSWVSASVVMAMLSQARVIDLRNVCFDERAVWYKGEWWRLLTNFFFMGDSVLSVFCLVLDVHARIVTIAVDWVWARAGILNFSTRVLLT